MCRVILLSRATAALAAIVLIGNVAIADVSAQLSATHKQVRTIEPEADGKRVQLTTFCLNAEGNILACCNGQTSTGLIQVYSPEGELLKTMSLDFVATAIDIGPDGGIYVAGNGNVCKLSADGTVLAKTTTPNLQNMDQLKKEVEQAAKEQREQMLTLYTDQLERLDKSIESAEKNVAKEDRTADQQSKINIAHQQRKFYADQLEMMKDSGGQLVDLNAMLQSKKRVTGMAANGKDVFVSCAAIKGYGYDIWRMTADLADPVKVVSQLRGCCGQMDIQCTDTELVIAENCEFKVAIYDRDGKRLRDFGGKDRSSEAGFGGCCNPMNVLCCPNGDILAAESSIGHIKRFNAAGEMVSFIGTATIDGGCKHCAMGYDAKRDYYYMQRQDEHHICVMTPKSEATEE